MKRARNFIILLLVFICISYFFRQFNLNPPKEVDYDIFASQILNGEIKNIEVQDNKVNILLKDDTKQFLTKEHNESITTLLKNLGISSKDIQNAKIKITRKSAFDIFLATIAPYLILITIVGILLFIMMRQIQGANSKAMMFGQSTAREMKKDRKKKITFKNVAGAKEAKEELQEIIEFLKKPQKFIELGAKIPKGILLMGSPGTGKTLLAKAVAGEADVPFYSISGSEFVEMFVGVGASRVRDLFKKAKKNAPCIIFVDEIDAVGRQRGAGLGGSHDEREQTLNQILVELDGFDTNTNIIVMAATNRPDILDPALLRPGRFDRQVVLDLPDIAEREAILKIHAKNKPLAKEINYRRIAQRTPGFSGADLANLLNEAAILTARQNKKIISQDNIFDSIEKVLLGPERKSHVITEKEKEITAYHEAGHAIVAHFIPEADPVQKISIIPRGRAGGYTLSIPIEDKRLNSKKEFLARLAVMLGGYQTEKLIFGDDNLTTGPSNDLMRVTKLARSLVTDFAMGDNTVPRTFGHKESLIFLGKDITEQKDYCEKTAENLDIEIDNLITKAAQRALEIIKKHKDLLDKLAKELLEKETIEYEEFEKIVGKKPTK